MFAQISTPVSHKYGSLFLIFSITIEYFLQRVEVWLGPLKRVFKVKNHCLVAKSKLHVRKSVNLTHASTILNTNL